MTGITRRQIKDSISYARWLLAQNRVVEADAALANTENILTLEKLPPTNFLLTEENPAWH